MASTQQPYSPEGAPLRQSEKFELFQAAAANLGPAQFQQQLATAALIPIVTVMIERSFARKTFQVDKIDGPVAVYTTKRRMKTYTVAKHGAAPVQYFNYPRLYITPFYIQVHPQIQMADLMDAQFDAAADILNDAGLEMAVAEDKTFLSLLATAAPDAGTTTTNSVPVAVAGPQNQGLVLSTNNYRVGTTNAAPPGGAVGEPGQRDFLLAKGLLESIGYNGDTILINPYTLGLLSSQQSFAYFLNWGNREVAETGVVTNPWGLRTIWSPLIPKANIYIFDNKELARLVEREAVTVRPSVEELVQKWLVYERIAPFIRNGNAVINLSYYV